MFCFLQERKKYGTLHYFACHPCARRGHANLLCIVPILVYVLPKHARLRAALYTLIKYVGQIAHVLMGYNTSSRRLPDFGQSSPTR